MLDNLIRTKGREGRRGYTLPKLDVEKTELEDVLPKKAIRQEKPGLPEVDEPTVDPALHQPLPQELGHRHQLLPFGLLHDEAQPPRQRGRRRGSGFRRAASPATGIAGPGCATGHARATGFSGGNLRSSRQSRCSRWPAPRASLRAS